MLGFAARIAASDRLGWIRWKPPGGPRRQSWPEAAAPTAAGAVTVGGEGGRNRRFHTPKPADGAKSRHHQPVPKMQARTYLLLLESGAGGHAAEADRARLLMAGFGRQGWLLRCRHEGPTLTNRTAAVEVIETFGTPSRELLLPALAIAGQRHGIGYELQRVAPGVRQA